MIGEGNSHQANSGLMLTKAINRLMPSTASFNWLPYFAKPGP